MKWRPEVDLNQGELFAPQPPSRIGLISCSKGKLDHRAPAAELYTGPFFRLKKAWIQQQHIRGWAILSAKHGVVMPDEEIDPYDLSLYDMTREEIDAWARRTQEQIVARWGRDTVYRILAGAPYCGALWGLPRVEDVIRAWTEERRSLGMRRPGMGIGVVKQRIKRDLEKHGVAA